MNDDIFCTDGLTEMGKGRLRAALEKQYRFSDGIASLGEKISRESKAGPVTKSCSDGMIEWSRRRFNRMDGRQQAAYEERLKAKRLYFFNRHDGTGWKIPKIVFDALNIPAE